MKKYLLLLILLTLIPFSGKALLTPDIYFKNIQVAKEEFQPEEVITGTVTLQNYEDFVANDLLFQYELLAKEVEEGLLTQLIDSKLDKQIFSLEPNQEVTKDFSYTLPKDLPKEDHFIFRIQLVNSKGEKMSWIDKKIKINSSGKFIVLDNQWLIRGAGKLLPMIGVNYPPGEQPIVQFDAKNVYKDKLEAYPEIITYKRNSYGEIVDKYSQDVFSINPQEKITKEITLPKLNKPESYLTEIKLLEKDSKRPISNSIFVRWVITGEKDAEILFVNPDKLTYNKGETAKIKVKFTGPAGYEFPGGPAKILVSLYNQKQELVGKGEKEVNLSQENETIIEALVTKPVSYPKISTEIIEGSQVLDKYEQKGKKVEQEGKEVKKPIAIYIYFVLLVLVLILVIMIFKGIKKRTLSILLILTVAGCLLGVAKYTQAAVSMISGPAEDPPSSTLNSPYPYQVFHPGDWIHFSGSSDIAACVNAFFNRGIKFFLVSRRGMNLLPVTTNPEFCYNCGGASSNMMKECLWGNDSNHVICTFVSLLGHDYLTRKTLEEHRDSYGKYRKVDIGVYSRRYSGRHWSSPRLIAKWVFHMDENGCQRWLGDWNYNYLYWDINGNSSIQWYKNAYVGPCWNVGDIDFSALPAQGYKFRDLGYQFLPDRYGGGWTYFSKWFRIPTDLNFTGDAWACVRLTGSHFWFNYLWDVVCQPIRIENPSTLSVNLSANPSSGYAPLNGVDLRADVSGTAAGTINYTFYCNRSDAGTNITPGYCCKIDGTNQNPYTAIDCCNYSSPGIYTAKVIVERGSLAAEDRVTITVESPPNQSPVADAGGPYTVKENHTIQLDGTGSYDPDGNIVSYLWSGECAAYLDNLNSSQPIFTAPEVGNETSFSCTLTVTDDDGASDSDTTTIKVKNIPRPKWIEIPPF